MDTPTRAATPTSPPFCCIVSLDGGQHAEAKLQGDLDLANSSLLRDELLTTVEGDIECITLDLAELTFLDSSGLAALVVVRKRAMEQGVTFELTSVPKPVRRVLEACGIAELFGPPDRERS